MKALAVVAGIIEDGEGRVLLAERPPGKHLAGLWEFPGGKIEPGELPREALRRELREELALEVDIVSELGLYLHTYDFGPIAMRVFRARALGTPRPSADVARFRWYAPPAVDLETLCPADVEPWRQFTRRARSAP